MNVARPTGSVPPFDVDLLLTVTSERDVRAVNALLDAGVPARWLNSGAVVVPRSHRAVAVTVAGPRPCSTTGST